MRVDSSCKSLQRIRSMLSVRDGLLCITVSIRKHATPITVFTPESRNNAQKSGPGSFHRDTFPQLTRHSHPCKQGPIPFIGYLDRLSEAIGVAV